MERPDIRTIITGQIDVYTKCRASLFSQLANACDREDMTRFGQLASSIIDYSAKIEALQGLLHSFPPVTPSGHGCVAEEGDADNEQAEQSNQPAIGRGPKSVRRGDLVEFRYGLGGTVESTNVAIVIRVGADERYNPIADHDNVTLRVLRDGDYDSYCLGFRPEIVGWEPNVPYSEKRIPFSWGFLGPRN